MTGSYPEKITTISFSFKKTRFETLHAKALQWPSQNFNFIGVNPDKSTGFDLEAATTGELSGLQTKIQQTDKLYYGEAVTIQYSAFLPPLKN